MLRFENVVAGTLFEAPDGTLAIKLANGTGVNVKTWELLPYGAETIVQPIGKLRRHSHKPKLKMSRFLETVLR